MSEKNSEMLNGGTELETINNATQKHRADGEKAKAQKNIGTKRRSIQRLVCSVCLGAVALVGIVGLCRMGAMVDWLGSVAACAVTLKLGTVIGGKEVK